VPSNIAEGQARYSRREFHHFLSNARGSLAEVETQIMLANDLGYLVSKEADTLLVKTSELGRILNGLIASIKSAV
jgi:four helix bundle protein